MNRISNDKIMSFKISDVLIRNANFNVIVREHCSGLIDEHCYTVAALWNNSFVGSSGVGSPTRWLTVHSGTTQCLACSTSTTAGSTPPTRRRRLPATPRDPPGLHLVVVGGVGVSTSASTNTASCGHFRCERWNGDTASESRSSDLRGTSCSSSA